MKIFVTKEVEINEREIKMLEMLADGIDLKTIGETMKLTRGTTGVYATRLYEKMGADNATQCVAMAIRRKIID